MDTEQTSADGVATGSAALGRTGGRAWSEAAQARGSLGVQWAPQPGRVRPGQAPAPRSPQPGRILWASAETAGRVTVPPSRPACDCPAATRSHLPRDPLPPLSAPFGGRLSVQHRKASLGFGHVQALGASDACFPGEVLGPLGGGGREGGPRTRRAGCLPGRTGSGLPGRRFSAAPNRAAVTCLGGPSKWSRWRRTCRCRGDSPLPRCAGGRAGRVGSPPRTESRGRRGVGLRG